MAVETHQRQLSDEIANVIDTLHGLFKEIGLSPHEREQRESSVYAAISAALDEQLRVVSQYVPFLWGGTLWGGATAANAEGIDREKGKMVQDCQQILAHIRQMERSLADEDEYDEEEDADSQITLPLLICLQGLKERHKAVKRRHADRYDSVKSVLCVRTR